MNAREIAVVPSTPGITFATISFPNPIKRANFVVIKVGSNCHSKLVPFIVQMSVMILVITRMSVTAATITRTTILVLLKQALFCAM